MGFMGTFYPGKWPFSSTFRYLLLENINLRPNDKFIVIWYIWNVCLIGCVLFFAGMKVNPLDLSPNYAGSLMAVTNGIGAITGVAAPYLVGVMTPHVSNLSISLFDLLVGTSKNIETKSTIFLHFFPSTVIIGRMAIRILDIVCDFRCNNCDLFNMGIWWGSAMELPETIGSGYGQWYKATWSNCAHWTHCTKGLVTSHSESHQEKQNKQKFCVFTYIRCCSVFSLLSHNRNGNSDFWTI